MRAERYVTPLLALGLGVGLWALVSRLNLLPGYLFPGPREVLDKGTQLFADGRMQSGILRSLARLAHGYGLAAAIGLPLGVALARVPRVRDALRPIVVGLQALPSICWLPLALLWFGLTEAAVIFVVVMGSSLAMAIATEDAVRGLDPLYQRVAQTFGVRGPRFVFGVLVPAALPGIVTGLKLGWSFAWRALLAAELLYASGGLGMLLTTGRELMEPAQVLAVMGVIVALGLLVDRVLFRTVENAIHRRWGYAQG